MGKAVLYYAPPSFYSQVAKLALVENGLEFDEKIVIPGPPNFGTYQPEYMRMNPQGTVPTLVFDGQIYDDSRKIVDLLMAAPSGTLLTPDDVSQAEIEHWIDRAYGLSERELAYGSGFQGKIGAHVNKKRLQTLIKLRVKNPDLDLIYLAKIEDIKDFIVKSQNPQHVAKVAENFDTEMDALDKTLEKRDFVAGSSYSMADVCWTIVIARQKMLGRAEFVRRVNVARWFVLMKGRPSYGRAEVMDKFKLSIMWKMISSLWKK